MPKTRANTHAAEQTHQSDDGAQSVGLDPATAMQSAAGGGNAFAQSILGLGGGPPSGKGGFKGDLGSFLARMEGAFGTSFGDIRLVDGPQGESGVSSGAAATTRGDKIFVGADFAAMPEAGQEVVLGHELAHVRQKQGQGAQGNGAAAEEDATRAADAALRGQPADPQVSAAPSTAQDISLGEAWDAVKKTTGDVVDTVSDTASAVGDAIVNWGIEQIGNVQDLIACIAELGEEKAKWIIDQLVTHKVEIVLSFITMNPTTGLLVYILRKLGADKIGTWFAGLDMKTAAKILAAAAAVGALALLAPALFALGAAAGPILKELGGPTIALLWSIAPDEMKKYAAQLITETWPVGLGMAFDGAIGATFGYPVFVDAEAFFEIAHFTQGTFKLRRGGTLAGGLDAGVGAGGYVGLGGGKKGGGQGEGGVGIGAEAGAQVKAGLKVKVHQEFEFPMQEDNAFAAMLVAITQADTSTSMTVLSQLTPVVAKVNPISYNTMTKLEIKEFAEGNAGAQAGLRTAGANTQEGGSTWNNQEGARDNGAAKWWQRWISASVFGRIAGEAGVGFEVRNKEFTPDSDGVRVPSVMEVDAYGEASAALAIVHAVPLISQALPQMPNFDGGVGIRATWTLRGGPQDSDPQITGPVWALYGKTGELDRYQGSASETSIAVGELNAETFSSVEKFLANIRGGSTFKRRFFLGTTLGRRYVNAANRQGAFNVMLPAEYKAYGFRIEGYLDLESTLSADQVRSIFRSITDVVDTYNAGGAPLQQLYTDILTFLSTGTGPAHVTRQLRSVADTLLKGLKTLHMHGLVGLSVAAGGQLSAGAKVRLQGRVGAQITMDQSLLEWAGKEVTVSDIEALINGTVSGENAVEIPGTQGS